MRDFVNLDYYCSRAGKTDPVANALNCLNSKLYFHCKTHFGAQRNWANMFMQTALLCAVRDGAGALRDFGSYSFLASEYLGAQVLPCVQDFAVRRERLVGAPALELISERLRAGQAVTVNTFAERLPFFQSFRAFDAPYDPAVNIFPHFLLLVGGSDTELFYVEDPQVLDRRQFTAHPDNRHVGVIEKRLLLPALQAFAEICEIAIDAGHVDYYTGPRYLRDFLAEELRARRRGMASPDGWVLSCGDALGALAACLAAPQAELFGRHPLLQRSGAPDLKTFLSWQFYDVLAAKKLQATALSEWEAHLDGASFADVCLTHRYSVLVWEKVCRTLNTATPAGARAVQRALAGALDAARDIEDKLGRSVAAFLEEEVAA